MSAKNKNAYKESLLGLLSLNIYLLKQYEVQIEKLDNVNDVKFRKISEILLSISNYIKFTLSESEKEK